MSDLFYVFGIALTLLAVVLSVLGLRSERFPGSRGVYTAVLAVMVVLVGASCAFAVVLSREEAEHHAEEYAEFEEEQAELLAEEEAQAEEEAAAEEVPAEEAGEEPQIEAEPQAGEAVALTSPPDGGLVFEPETLEATAGEVTLDYTNPSEVPHNVAIEAGGETLAQGETVTGGDSGPATAALDAGDYVYYCSIPGHREAGMEGQLTVSE